MWIRFRWGRIKFINFRFDKPLVMIGSLIIRAVYHNLWYFWARVLATSVATGHYHAETTAGMLIIVGDMVSEP